MKKTKHIQLILITAALASCNQAKKQDDWESGNKTHIRSDSTAPYTRVQHHSGMGGVGTALLWYYAFRPYGNYNNGRYQRAVIILVPSANDLILVAIVLKVAPYVADLVEVAIV